MSDVVGSRCWLREAGEREPQNANPFGRELITSVNVKLRVHSGTSLDPSTVGLEFARRLDEAFSKQLVQLEAIYA